MPAQEYDERGVAQWDDDAPEGADRWDAPLPLGRQVRLPSFPVDVLPSWLGDFVTELSEATQTPTDLPGVLVLAAVAAAAGGRAVVEVRRGWREPVNIFAAVGLAPGTRKSAVFARVTKPLTLAERDAITATRPLIVEAATRRRAADAAAEREAATAGKVDPGDREEAIRKAVEAAEMAEAVTVPVVPRLLADDATPEALASLLVEQKGRIAVLSPEGDTFDLIAGRYSKSGPVLGVYLKGHAGDALRVDRKGRPPEHVEAPALTIGLAVQPEVLSGLADQPGFRGRGLLARFLFSLPVNNVGRRKPGAAPVSELVEDRYSTEMQALVRSLAEWDDPAVIPFTARADRLLLDLEHRTEPRLGTGGDLSHIADWGSKLSGATARLAGLLHLASHVRDGWGKPVQPEQVEAAIALADYFADHALGVFDLMAADPLIGDARAVAEWTSDREHFTRREAHRAFESRFQKANDLVPVLALLEERGWVRQLPQPEPDSRGGRPPSPTYVVNPLTQRQNRRNRHNPTDDPSSVGCGGSVDHSEGVNP